MTSKLGPQTGAHSDFDLSKSLWISVGDLLEISHLLRRAEMGFRTPRWRKYFSQREKEKMLDMRMCKTMT